jgi:hypothetical protein
MRRAWSALIVVTFAAGCTLERSTAPPAEDKAGTSAAAAPANQERLQALGYVARAAAKGGAAPSAAPPGAPRSAPDLLSSRKLIRTAQITIEVDDYRAAAARVDELARAQGGYLAGSQSTGGRGDRRHGRLTLRVPSEHFDAVVGGLKGVGKVLTDKTDSEDVTKAYFDLETRLRVKRDTEARLREILRTRTARLADVLEAERELARVTEEIEGMEGQRRFYDQQVALSTIVLSLEEPQSVARPDLLHPVRQAFRESLRVMSLSAAALIYVVVFLAPWAVPAAAAWLAVRRWRRRTVPPPVPAV